MSLNQRINLLYFLDSLLDDKLQQSGYTGTANDSSTQLPYNNLIKRDLPKIVEMVVPDTREGVLNLMSAQQVGNKLPCRSIRPSRAHSHIHSLTGPQIMEDEAIVGQ